MRSMSFAHRVLGSCSLCGRPPCGQRARNSTCRAAHWRAVCAAVETCATFVRNAKCHHSWRLCQGVFPLPAPVWRLTCSPRGSSSQAAAEAEAPPGKSAGKGGASKDRGSRSRVQTPSTSNEEDIRALRIDKVRPAPCAPAARSTARRRPAGVPPAELACKPPLLVELRAHAAPAPPGHGRALDGARQAQELRASGQEPYAYRFARTHLAAELQERFRDLPAGEMAELQARRPRQLRSLPAGLGPARSMGQVLGFGAVCGQALAQQEPQVHVREVPAARQRCMRMGMRRVSATWHSHAGVGCRSGLPLP